MKLIYCYIERFRNIENQEVSLSDELQISFEFLGGFEEKAYFCGRLQLKNLKGELLWIHWIKNFGKNVKLL